MEQSIPTRTYTLISVSNCLRESSDAMVKHGTLGSGEGASSTELEKATLNTYYLSLIN